MKLHFRVLLLLLVLAFSVPLSADLSFADDTAQNDEDSNRTADTSENPCDGAVVTCHESDNNNNSSSSNSSNNNSSSGTAMTMMMTSLLPPLKQVDAGVAPSDVTCTQDRSILLRISDGSPACVYPSSIETLILRGWAIHVLPDIAISNNNSEIFVLGDYPTTSETVKYFGDVSGYLARPATDGDYPGVVMIHEWWGLNDYIKEMADKLASHGYVVLAVDLYGGEVATSSEQARLLITGYDMEQGLQNMNAAALLLGNDYSADKIGSIGWCFGGGQSLNLALGHDDAATIDATVIYYGSLVTDTEALSSIHWPVLGIFAGLDQGIPVATVAEFESSLNELNIESSIHIYDDVDHAFANPSGARYAPEEAKSAWEQTLAFLESSLK